jgi:molybdate transport system ATP-binding protein
MTSRLLLGGIDLTVGSFRLAIDLDVQLGCLGVFGPSGAGKTTLLETIAGLRHPQSGQVELDGNFLSDPSRKVWVPVYRRRVGYVPQDLALFSHLSVLQNIVYGASQKGEQTAGSEPTVEAICEILNLAPLLNRRPATLSGGEKQRVALARALAARPRVLLLDEPLTGLDQDRKDAILNYLRMLRQRWAVPMIYVSHQADEMMALCDEVIVLREGTIQGRGRPSEVFEISSRPAYRLRAALGTSSGTEHVKEP